MTMDERAKNVTPLHKFRTSTRIEPESTKMFLICSMKNFTEQELNDLKQDFMFQLIEKRLKFYSAEANVNVVIFIAYMSNGVPGQAVQYCHSIAHLNHELGREVNMDDISNAYPNGFPDNEGMTEHWFAQKDQGANLIDMVAAWPTWKEHDDTQKTN